MVKALLRKSIKQKEKLKEDKMSLGIELGNARFVLVALGILAIIGMIHGHLGKK